MIEFHEYLHNRGQQDILKDQLIKIQKEKIEILERRATINESLDRINDIIIKEHEDVMKLQDAQYEALKDLATKQPTFWEKALTNNLWRKKQ